MGPSAPTEWERHAPFNRAPSTTLRVVPLPRFAGEDSRLRVAGEEVAVRCQAVGGRGRLADLGLGVERDEAGGVPVEAAEIEDAPHGLLRGAAEGGDVDIEDGAGEDSVPVRHEPAIEPVPGGEIAQIGGEFVAGAAEIFLVDGDGVFERVADAVQDHGIGQRQPDKADMHEVERHGVEQRAIEVEDVAVKGTGWYVECHWERAQHRATRRLATRVLAPLGSGHCNFSNADQTRKVWPQKF